jgi:F-type H+-transporting ATPase subunit b
MKKSLIFGILAVALLIHQPVWAAEAGEHGWGWWETLGRWINLSILFGIIFYFVRKPVGAYYRERQEGITRSIREAAEAREEARRKLAAAEQRLQGIETELSRIRQDAEQEAQLERRRILDQTRLEADRLMESARREIDGMTLSARKQIREYAAQLAVQLAEEKIRREMKAKDEERVINRFLAELGYEGEKKTVARSGSE